MKIRLKTVVLSLPFSHSKIQFVFRGLQFDYVLLLTVTTHENSPAVSWPGTAAGTTSAAGVQTRAGDKPSRRFHNHGDGPNRVFSVLLSNLGMH